jgi:hypothetical protein
MFIAAFAGAQKLPNVQKESVRAPANIKVDGKATEWDNKFKAQNSATELFYTISNDDQSLYLTAQTKHKDIVDKIMRGGITLNVNPTLVKKSDSQVSVTYPSFDFTDMVKLTGLLAIKNYPAANADKDPATFDDVNKAFIARAKTIYIKGLNLSTPEISIYNENGIQVASHFDDTFGYTYELAIPLKSFLTQDSKQSFSYQIKVNEPKQTPKFDANSPLPPPPPPMLKTAVATTDFWGEYTLAK